MQGSMIALLVCVAVASASTVPLIAWSNTPHTFASVPAWGEAINVNSVIYSQLAQLVSSDVIVVFQQDKLTVEDFTVYGDVYSNSNNGGSFTHLMNYIDNSASVVIPNVRSAFDSPAQELISYFTRAALAQQAAVVHVSSETPFSASSLKAGKLNLVIVSLNNVASLEDKTAVLAANDELIHTIFQAASQFGKASAVFTSQTQETVEVAHKTARRQASPVGAATPIAIIDANYSYVYFTAPIFMGLFVGLLVVFFAFVGSYELLIVQNPDRFASSTDKPLIVPNN